MQFHLICKRAIIGALLIGATVMAGTSTKQIIDDVKVMEQEWGVAMMSSFKVSTQFAGRRLIPNNHVKSPPMISPDGTALAWWSFPVMAQGEKVPFLTVESLKEGIQPVWVEGRVATGKIGLSSGADVIVAMALQYPRLSKSWKLLVIDRHSGIVVHDLTPFVTQFKVTADLMTSNYIEDISVSGMGNLVALGTPEQIQVLEIPSGKSVYTGPGSFPRLSPDGKRLAFVDKDKLWIYSFADGATVQLLKDTQVKGIGGWSPDGRFLLAGAWTKKLSFEKRQIIVDTTKDEYAVIGKLGEGDYGTNFAWVSTKLLEK
jgi:hypothetical protein